MSIPDVPCAVVADRPDIPTGTCERTLNMARRPQQDPKQQPTGQKPKQNDQQQPSPAATRREDFLRGARAEIKRFL